LFGQQGKDTLDGGDGNDLLVGGEDGDTIIGGEGDDTLAGETNLENPGIGTDKLLGGKDNDTYRFWDNWGTDEITELVDEGQDTLDFSRVTASTSVMLGSSTTPVTPSQFFTITSGSSVAHATNFIEKIIGAKGATTYTVSASFADTYDADGFQGKTLTIENLLDDSGNPLATLDLSQLGSGLTVTIARATGKYNQVTVDVGGKKIVMSNVANIIGTQSDDTFVFEREARLSGNLDGGTGKNTLVYQEKAPLDLAGLLSPQDLAQLKEQLKIAPTDPLPDPTAFTGVRFSIDAGTMAGQFPSSLGRRHLRRWYGEYH